MRPRTTGRLFLDVRKWQRDGLLRAGEGIETFWTDDRGRELGRVQTYVRDAATALMYYCVTDAATTNEPVSYLIRFERTPCHFGGERVWFRCPVPADRGRGCGRRAAVLYLVDRHFRCRVCAELLYGSQWDAWGDRYWNRAGKGLRRLGWTGDAMAVEALPPKPRGMHWRTYLRLRERIDADLVCGWEAQLAKFHGWADGLERRNGRRRTPTPGQPRSAARRGRGGGGVEATVEGA